LHDDISARGLKVELSWQIPFSMWRVDYKIDKSPLVSIIIPTKDQADVLRQCLSSIAEKTTYKNLETIIVDTGSVKEETWRLYDEYKQPLNLKIVKWDKPFNFSSVCNFGGDHSRGEYLLFLNNDTEVITPNWIEDMLGYAIQKDIGAVGCKLYYPDGKLQHGGIILGVGGQKGTPGIAGHFFPAYKEEPTQDPGQLLYDGGTRNFAAVTAACLMVSKAKFDKVNGFDTKFRIAFNDVDFCLELLKSGLRNVYLPHVQLYHHESISIGKPGAKQRDLEVFAKEIDMMLRKWRRLIVNDPYYHPEFRRDVASARLKV
jgi:GT2 family glycosyltransferase